MSDVVARLRGCGLSADALLWNWARWCWQGETVGNMAVYFPEDERAFETIQQDHGQAVQDLYSRQHRYVQMAVTAEYPQKHVRFAGLDQGERQATACRWIKQATAVCLTGREYRLAVDQFRALIRRAAA